MATLPIAVTAQLTFVTNGGSIIITGCTGNPTALTIPATTNGWPVISIADSAFSNKTTVTTVTIPDSVVIIGNNSFEFCTSMTNLTIGQGVILLGNSTFKSCTKLGSLTIPDSVLKLGTNDFAFCGALTNVTLGAQVPGIGNYDFQQCTNLKTMAIPGNVTNLGSYAFSLCKQLNTVTLSNVVNIGKYCFMNCLDLNHCTLPPSVRNIDSYAFSYCVSLPGMVIPDSVTNLADSAFTSCYALTNAFFGTNLVNIGAQAFGNCYKLRSVQIPDAVTNIGASSFSGCTNVSSVVIGSGLRTIGDGSFWNGWALKSFEVNPTNLYFSSVGGVLFNKNQGTLVQFPLGVAGSYEVPGSVTNLGMGAFLGCALTNVTVPASVMEIGVDAFSRSTNLLAIAVDPNNAYYNSLDGVLFDKNHTILLAYPAGLPWSSYTIPNGVTNIYYDAFMFTKLTSLTMPASLQTVLGNVFFFTPSLTNFFFQGDSPTNFNPTGFVGPVATVFYLPQTTGWSNTFVGLPTALWNPQAQAGDAGFGFQAGQFGFNITGTANIPIVVEACTNLATPVWTTVQNCFVTNGVIHFADSDATDHLARYYRIRSP